MKKELNNILLSELDAITLLLKALDEQYDAILKNDIFSMEAVVEEIENCNKIVAQCEVKRIEITNGVDMRQLVYEFKDTDLEENYRKVKRLIQETILQKDTNELLIKQGLGFTNRMLNIINPHRGTKTYNSYGKIPR